jgi:hypothetical protein
MSSQPRFTHWNQPGCGPTLRQMSNSSEGAADGVGASIKRVILACDESGAKGYADQNERHPGEVGVFAGLLIPEEDLARTTATLNAAVNPFRGTDGKLHITDLAPQQQAALRTAIFDAVRETNLPCFWYAIHAAGFHQHYRKMQQMLADSRSAVAALNPTPRVKTGSARDAPDLLHNALFQGLYMHLVAFIEERTPGPIRIEVRTDRVDAPIARLFNEKAARLLDDSPRRTSVKGFDVQDQRLVEAHIEMTTDYPDALKVATKVETLAVVPTGDDDPLVIAADVLANSLCHLFHQRGPRELYTDLNRPDAILAHPLAHHLCAFHNWGGADLVGDRLYRHPLAPPL